MGSIPRRCARDLMLGAQHYTQLGDRGQGVYPAATMLGNGHGEELPDERLARGRVDGVPEARRPAHEAPGSAMRPAERDGQEYSDRLAWRGRDRGRRSFSEEP